MPYDVAEASSPADVEQFISDARELFTFGRSADELDREEATDDNRFANASDLKKSQWAAEPLKARTDAQRPVLQWNRIPTFVAQVVNDGRQNKPSIKIAAADGGEKATAEYFQDRIRHLEYECDADIAYDTAREQQVTSGRAAIRVSTEWVQGTFKQRVCIEPIEDQFSVVWDPAAKLYDRSDAGWCFVTTLMSKAQYIREYGQQAFDRRLDFENGNDTGWCGLGEAGDLYQIAEYYRKEYKKRTLVLLGSGDVPVWRDALTDEQYKSFKASNLIRRERQEDDCTIVQYIIDGAQILGRKEWLGRTIPIVPLWGRTATVNGIRRTFSLIRNAKDPQRTVNLYVSNICELIAQMPKTPYLAPIGSIPATQENAWQFASNSPLAFLLYKNHDADGNKLDRPERVMQEPPIQALTIGLQQSIDAIKAAMGIFDASLGARSNETSGIAIERRKKSAEVVNYHFSDNESRSRKRIGEILIEILPKLDTPGSTVPIRSEDGKTSLVPIGQEYQHPKTGEKVIHDLTAGDYGVTVSTGPSYNSQREQAYERDAALIQAAPELMWVFGDQLFANDDTAGAQERAERMKKAIMMKTPGLIEEPGEQKALPPEVQQQMQAMQQELEHTKAFAQKLHEEIATKQPELAMKKYTVDETEKTKRVLGLAALDSQEARTQLEEELGITHKAVDQAHEIKLKLMDQSHQQELQEGQQEHASGESEADRQHQSGESEAERAAAAEQAKSAAKEKK